MAKGKAKTAEQIRQSITEKMIEAVKKGTPPWRQPWTEGMCGLGMPCNFHSKRRYTGINPLILLWWSIVLGYKSRNWGTYKAWLDNLGVHVKKGETAAWVTLFRMIPKKINGVIQKDTKGKDKKIPIMREFPVFNAEQVQAPTVAELLKRNTTKDALLEVAKKYLPASQQPKKTATREAIARQIHTGIEAKLATYLPPPVLEKVVPNFEPADELIKATGADIRHGSDRACYIPDYIRMPNRGRFDSTAAYYETIFHELIHWTEHKDRVGRKEGHDYAFGELVAEIGAAFLSMELGVPLAEQMLPNSQSYVAGWLEKMGSDTKFIFDAANQASKAVDFLLAFVGKQNPAYHSEDDSESEEGNKEVLERAA